MTLIEYDVAPHECASKPLFLTLKYFVAGDDDVITGASHAVIYSVFEAEDLAAFGDLFKAVTFLRWAMKAENTEVGSPFFAFRNPRGDNGEGTHNEEGALMVGGIRGVGGEVGKKRKCLEGFPETHFVTEDARGTVVVEPDKEREAGELIAFHSCSHAEDC